MAEFGLKFKLIQALMHVLVTCKNEQNLIKNEALEWQQHFSHYKSMGIFQDVHGKVIPQYMIQSSRFSNSCETSWLASLPARMVKFRSKIKALEWPRDYMSFFRRSRSNNFVVSGGIWPKFELIQARMSNIQSKMMSLEWPQDFSHTKSMGIYSDAQWHVTPQSVIRSSRISNWFKTLRWSSLPARMMKIQSKMKSRV